MNIRTRPAPTLATLAAALLAGFAASAAWGRQPPPPPPAPLPPPPVPPENPITETKRMLGKALFWDEQLSSSNTQSCGTCHTATRGGVDNRRARNPGPDNTFFTADDPMGSPGVIASDALNNYFSSQFFGTNSQVTGRGSMSVYTAGYATDTFWDGRARTTFRDPVTNAVVIANGGGLESQVVGPPVNSTEMAHVGRSWDEIAAKLTSARPLAVATSVPPDVAAMLTPDTRYRDLFRAAFGDETINASRIAMAIATYERTLVPDQTPFDNFARGNQNALTANQIAGFNAMGPVGCNVCHGGPVFSNQTFRNIGVRPPTEDIGRQAVTGVAADQGRMKVPSLRNAGLRNQFFHGGQVTTVGQVLNFYARLPNAIPQFQQNIDPAVTALRFAPGDVGRISDFINNGLTDPRVAARTFPFDEPTLYTQRPASQPAIVGGGTAGSGGLVPAVLAVEPAFLGSSDFRVGVTGALGGTTATVRISRFAPINGAVVDYEEQGPISLSGSGSGTGIGTFHWSIPENFHLAGNTYFFQWAINDPSAPGGKALSTVARITPFCAGGGCPTCPYDIDLDGNLTPDDLGDYITTYFGPPNLIAQDFTGDGSVNPDDLGDYITGYFEGC